MSPGSGGGSGGGPVGSGGVGTGGRTGGSGGAGTGGVTATCQDGATQCGNGGVQTCVSGQWGAVKGCGTRQKCAQSGGTAKCTCAPDAVCATIGTTCAGTSTVDVCMQDADGCFYAASSTMCGARQTCTGSAGVAKCTCQTNPACTAAGPSCSDSKTLTMCTADGDGCLVSTSSACGSALVCERIAPASCEDPVFEEWPVPDVHPTNYKDNGDGTVTDSGTGLMWQKVSDSATHTQADAVTYCNSLTLAGQRDWRLPSEIELVSISDFAVPSPGPTLNTVFSGPANGYWSSTLVAGSPSSGWVVNFIYGAVTNTAVTFMGNVRCAR